MRLPVRRSRRAAAALAAALAALVPPARAAWHPVDASWDVFAFAQRDYGGQPDKAEGFRYVGARSAVDFLVDAVTRFRTSVALSFVSNDDAARVQGVDSITSASSRLLALDASAGLERRVGESWTLRPGLYYHHQKGYISEGVDLSVDRDVAGGDATLSASLQVRVSFLDLDTWYGGNAGSDLLATNALGLSWRQNVSPSVEALLGVQYTRQDGYLGDSFNYVLVRDPIVGTAVASEALPDVRHRGQINGRVRWSPWRDAALGLDASAYRDSWEIRHVAVEPGVALPLPGGSRLRSWWRVSSQDASEFHAPRLVALPQYRTQDSDLGAFTMNSAGVSVVVPRGSRAFPDELEVSLYGFSRNDGLRAGGANAGFRRRW